MIPGLRCSASRPNPPEHKEAGRYSCRGPPWVYRLPNPPYDVGMAIGPVAEAGPQPFKSAVGSTPSTPSMGTHACTVGGFDGSSRHPADYTAALSREIGLECHRSPAPTIDWRLVHS